MFNFNEFLIKNIAVYFSIMMTNFFNSENIDEKR